MSIKLSLDVHNLNQETLGRFLLAVEMVNPDLVMLDWAGQNPVCAEFKSSRPPQDVVRNIAGRYHRRLITVYTCFLDSQVSKTIVHEYAHHLQWLNHCAKTRGWVEFNHPSQDYLYSRWKASLPSWAYAGKNPVEMTAEAFCVCHGYKLNWDVPVEFVQDWTLFFLDQPFFRDTFLNQ